MPPRDNLKCRRESQYCVDETSVQRITQRPHACAVQQGSEWKAGASLDTLGGPSPSLGPECHTPRAPPPPLPAEYDVQV